MAVKKEDRDVLHFLWVDDVNSAEPKIVEYRFAADLLRVPFSYIHTYIHARTHTRTHTHIHTYIHTNFIEAP